MSSHRMSLGSVRVRFLLLLVAALAASLLPSVTPPANAVATEAAHPFSHPVFHPLRTPSRIGCVNTNCPDHPDGHGGTGWHKYWAIDYYYPHDLPDNPPKVGDGVFAAGAGRFHVGGRVPRDQTDANGCFPAGSKVTPGNWVWIDHGGGVVSRYHHLHRIDLDFKEGDLVTPHDQIGTMGVSGRAGDGCRKENAVVYLHFEVRKNASYTSTGLSGIRINPGNMFACNFDGTRAVYPRDLAPPGKTWTNWDHVVYQTPAPGSHSRCIPAIPSTAHRPASRVTFGDRSARVTWPDADIARPAVGSLVMSVERYYTTIGYNRRVFVTLPASGNSTTYPLENGVQYRITLAYRNAAGYSAWGPAHVGIPAGRPFAPGYRRPGISSGPHSVRVYWSHSKANGTPVTGYIVGFRRKGSTWGPWEYYRINNMTTLSYGWAGLPSRRLFEAKVRATSLVGASNWSKTYQIATTS